MENKNNSSLKLWSLLATSILMVLLSLSGWIYSSWSSRVDVLERDSRHFLSESERRITALEANQTEIMRRLGKIEEKMDRLLFLNQKK